MINDSVQRIRIGRMAILKSVIIDGAWIKFSLGLLFDGLETCE
jgi:hypothetical protein